MRQIEITVGSVVLHATLLDTATADRIWQFLPIFATVQKWPGVIYFETDVESGLEPGAGFVVQPGDIVFTPDQDTISLAFAATPISRPGEMRLARPANVWAQTRNDISVLSRVRAGEQVTMRQITRKMPDLRPAEKGNQQS